MPLGGMNQYHLSGALENTKTFYRIDSFDLFFGGQPGKIYPIPPHYIAQKWCYYDSGSTDSKLLGYCEALVVNVTKFVESALWRAAFTGATCRSTDLLICFCFGVRDSCSARNDLVRHAIRSSNDLPPLLDEIFETHRSTDPVRRLHPVGGRSGVSGLRWHLYRQRQ